MHDLRLVGVHEDGEHLLLSNAEGERFLLTVDDALRAVGAERLIWGCDITMETGLAKLRALEVIGISDEEMSAIRWRNAARIFPAGSLPGCEASASAAGTPSRAGGARR